MFVLVVGAQIVVALRLKVAGEQLAEFATVGHRGDFMNVANMTFQVLGLAKRPIALFAKVRRRMAGVNVLSRVLLA